MNDMTSDDTVIERLRMSLETEALPAGARDHATHLIKRLSSPVRVVLMGLPRSGKSELLNMFVGQRVIPKDTAFPSLELIYGPTAKTTLTAVDGTVTDIDGIDLESAIKGQTAFIKLEMPLPVLQRIRLLEVVTDGAPADQRSAIDWAVRRTDIALWCSQDFGSDEQSIWAHVPDSLKDHAFLVLTKADELSANGELSRRVAELEDVVSEEFHSLFAVATLQAISAVKQDGSRDESMMHASGGGALMDQVLRHAERGRRADIDSAYLFLSRYQIRTDTKVKAPVSSLDTKIEPHEPVEKKTIVEEVVLNVPEVAPEPVAPPESVEAPVESNVIAFSPAPLKNADLFTEAVRYLRRRGDGLFDQAEKLGDGQAGGLIENCIDAVEHLVDLFSQDETGCEAADEFIDDLAEAAEMMVLMQVESGDAPAADAVTLLLQLRRDMETSLAA